MIGRAIILFASVLSTACLASSDEWDAYIRLIEQADPKTLQAFPEKIDSIGNTLDGEHAKELTTALGMALVKDPLAVINATQSLDIITEPLKQRFATSLICCIPSMAQFPTRAQTEDYYAKAELALKKAGPAAAECLEIMQEAHAEMQQYH